MGKLRGRTGVAQAPGRRGVGEEGDSAVTDSCRCEETFRIGSEVAGRMQLNKL